MKKLLLILLNITFLFALTDDLLIIEAKLYPKVIMLENKFIKHPKIGIIYNESSLEVAKKISSFLAHNNYVSFLIKENDIKEADGYIITFKNPSRSLITALLKTHKLIFGVYPESIKYTMVSLYLGPRVKLYINPKLIKQANIYINPILFKVGRIYEE